MTRRNLIRTGAAIAAAILLIVLFGGRIATVSDLYPDALPANPWFVPGHAFLLYVATPLLLLAALVVFVAPGLLLVRAFGRTTRTAPLFLKGTLIAFVVNSAALGALKLLSPAPPAAAHAATLFGLDVVAWLLFAVRSVRGQAVDGNGHAEDGRRWGWLIAIPVIAAILLIPILFWQDLNPDGLEALTGGRSLAWFALPRFPDGETPGLNLGMITSSYPIHWFIALFGLIDGAGRLPVLLYAPMIWAGLVALIEVRAPRRLSVGEEFALVAALAVFIAALGFNDTYHAYSTDIASPANIDFLAMAGVLATLYFFWNEEPGWFLFAALFTHLTRPTGLMLLGLLFVGVFLFDRERLRPRLVLIGAAIAMMMAWTVGFEKLLPRLIDISIDSGAGQVAGRFRYLRFDHFARVLWVVVPAGILPVLALPQVRRQDNVARVLSLMTVLYFGVFYVIAFTALHHFAPATLLLIVIFWRLALKSPAAARRTAVTVGAAALALWLSLPRSMALDRTMRPIGAATVWNEGNYGGGYDEYRLAYDHKALLLELFKPFWEVADPAAEFIGSPWLQIRYARHGAILPETNYVVQPLGDAPPAGFTELATDSAAALWVRDMDRWRADRYRHRDTEWQSPVLRVRRETLFWMLGVDAGTYDIDVRRLLERMRGR